MNNTYIYHENNKAFNALTSMGYTFIEGIKEYFSGYSPNGQPFATSKVFYCTNANMSGKQWNKLLKKNNLLFRKKK